MATKITDRHCPVHFYDVIVSSLAAEGYKVSSPSCAPIGLLFSMLLSADAKGHVLNPHAKVVMKSLDDLSPLNNHENGYALLLNCAELSKPDPRFTHFKTNALRADGKQSIEAVTKSLYAVLLPDAATPNKDHERENEDGVCTMIKGNHKVHEGAKKTSKPFPILIKVRYS